MPSVTSYFFLDGVCTAHLLKRELPLANLARTAILSRPLGLLSNACLSTPLRPAPSPRLPGVLVPLADLPGQDGGSARARSLPAAALEEERAAGAGEGRERSAPLEGRWRRWAGPGSRAGSGAAEPPASRCGALAARARPPALSTPRGGDSAAGARRRRASVQHDGAAAESGPRAGRAARGQGIAAGAGPGGRRGWRLRSGSGARRSRSAACPGGGPTFRALRVCSLRAQGPGSKTAHPPRSGVIFWVEGADLDQAIAFLSGRFNPFLEVRSKSRSVLVSRSDQPVSRRAEGRPFPTGGLPPCAWSCH